jgi:hypothetical protein
VTSIVGLVRLLECRWEGIILFVLSDVQNGVYSYSHSYSHKPKLFTYYSHTTSVIIIISPGYTLLLLGYSHFIHMAWGMGVVVFCWIVYTPPRVKWSNGK